MNKNSAEGGVTINKVPLRVKIGYGLGGAGDTVPYNLYFFYFIFFLTDIAGVPNAWAGTIATIGLFWDAITDPVIGHLSDRSKSKLGRRRKYMMVGFLPLAACLYLMFASVDFSGAVQIAYYCFVAILLWTTYTIYLIPYLAFNAELSSDYDERNRIRTLVMVIQYALLILCTSGPMWILDYVLKNGGTEKSAWGYTGIVFGVILAVCCFICIKVTKGYDRHITEEKMDETKENIFKNMFSLLKIRAFRILCLMGLVLVFAATFINTSLVYVLTYVTGLSAALQGTFWIVFSVISCFTIPIVGYFCNRYGKKETMMVLWLIGAAMGIVFYFVGMGSLVLVYIYAVFASTTTCSFFAYYIAAGYDITEIVEYKSGARKEGSVTSLLTVMQKLGSGICTLAMGGILSFIDYDATLDAQTASTNNGLLALCTLVPGAFFLIAFFIISRWPVKKKDLQKLQRELAKKNAGEEHDSSEFEHLLR